MTTPAELYDKVNDIIEQVRPSLQSHGGDVNLVDITDANVVRVQLTGSCAGCPMQMMTLRGGIERILAELVPEVKGVEAVDANDFEWTE